MFRHLLQVAAAVGDAVRVVAQDLDHPAIRHPVARALRHHPLQFRFQRHQPDNPACRSR